MSFSLFPSLTVKLRSSNLSEAAIYLTISRRRLFVNSKDMSKICLITPLLEAYSALLGDGEDPQRLVKVIELMKQDFDPMGPYMTDFGLVNGLVCHMGALVEKYTPYLDERKPA